MSMPWSTKPQGFLSLSSHGGMKPPAFAQIFTQKNKKNKKTPKKQHFQNISWYNELDNFLASFVHQKAATPPSTNPGSATDSCSHMHIAKVRHCIKLLTNGYDQK